MKLGRFFGVVALIVLAGRQLAYALAPRPTLASVELQHAVGGPGLVVTTLVLAALSLAVASAVLWLASIGVRERHLLSGTSDRAPSLQLARVSVDALVFAGTSCLAFAALESYLHWRAGLGFHGLRCLVGPMHRDAIPILSALAVVAAALRGALRHVLAWMRRTVALLRLRPRVLPRPLRVHRVGAQLLHRSFLAYGIRVRGPPCAAVPVHP
jgi:hypothetical protein